MVDYSVLAIPKPTPKKKGGKGPRRSGNRVERLVAKEIGDEAKRVPMSGGAKNFATGDIEVTDATGGKFLKLEVKYTGQVNTKGEKSYNLTLPVLKQMEDEAHKDNEIGALVIQFKGGEKYVTFSFDDFLKIFNYAKVGHAYERSRSQASLLPEMQSEGNLAP